MTTSDKLMPSADDMRASLAEAQAKGGLPTPTGWKIMIAMPDYTRVTRGGIHLPDDTVDREEMASPIGLVVSMGPACYKDEVKFPSGPYCKVGDFVVVRPYSGTRIICHGKEFRFINDDTVEAVVLDPGVIRRV